MLAIEFWALQKTAETKSRLTATTVDSNPPNSACRVLRLRRAFGRLVSDALACVCQATLHFCALRGLLVQVSVSFRGLDRTHSHWQGVLLEIHKNPALRYI